MICCAYFLSGEIPKNTKRRNPTDWDALCRGLKRIGYDGPINFEVHPAFWDTPKVLYPEILKLLFAVGRYLRICIE
jgi:hypothetical protein